MCLASPQEERTSRRALMGGMMESEFKMNAPYGRVELTLDDHPPTSIAFAGNGPLVIFVHGWAHGMSRWERYTSSISTRYTFVSVDLPGFGTARGHPVHAPYIENLGLFIGRLIPAAEKHFGQPVEAIIGHSLGACAIARVFQGLPPEARRPKRIILLDAPFSGSVFLKTLTAAYPLLVVLACLRSAPPKFFSDFGIRVIGLLTTRNWQAMDEQFLADVRAPSPVFLVNTLMAVAWARVSISPAPAVPGSIVLARGARDWLSNARTQKRYAEAWAAMTHTFNASSHTPFMEEPAEFGTWLTEILEG